MRRLLSLALLAAAAAAFALLGTGASDGTGSSYLVDAEFRNAFSVIPGEDVKIAGVKVGSIKDLDVTDRQTASVLLEVTEPGFGDWRADAECSIRPQSLIGEKFVECTPTQPRPQGAAVPPLLRTRKRDGKTVAVLPISQTSRPVDLDLVGNITRLPYRQRLTILLNEFGAGLAGRGADLAKVIRTADPSLKATDKVLDILGAQDAVLRKLATDSDAALAPLARDRRQVADFVTQSGKVAEATADQRQALEAGIQRLPRFLRELRPTMERLGALSDQGTPLLRDLGTAGPDVGRFVKELGPFSSSATASLTSLGDASVVGRQALVESRPIVGDLKDLTGSSKVLARDLRELTESFRDTGGIERLMDYAYYQVAAVNGFDKFGHYLRAQLLVNLCSSYQLESNPQCIATFVKKGSAAASPGVDEASRDPALVRVDKVLRGADPKPLVAADAAAGRDVDGSSDGRTADAVSTRAATAAATSDPVSAGAAGASPAAAGASAAGTGASAARSSAAATAPSAGVRSLLDYLLGSGT